MSTPIQFPATLTSARRHADKSVSWTHRSNFEMSTEDFAEIDRRLGDVGYGCWASNELQPTDIPDVPADEALGSMTPSQEMRWWLKKLHDLTGKDIDWPDFYRSEVRRRTEHIKSLVKEIES